MVFWVLSIVDPSAASLSASMFPSMSACPFTPSKDVAPTRFLSLFIIG